MKTRVGIADLKSRLSHYLRLVRRGGELTVYDLGTPVARVVPVEGTSLRLSVRRPGPNAPRVSEVALPPPLPLKGDVVALLREERGSR